MAYTFSEGINRDYAFYSTPSRRERIARIDTLATLLDTAFILPGTNLRFGLDAIVGLVPGIGDVITTRCPFTRARSTSGRCSSQKRRA